MLIAKEGAEQFDFYPVGGKEYFKVILERKMSFTVCFGGRFKSPVFWRVCWLVSYSLGACVAA